MISPFFHIRRAKIAALSVLCCAPVFLNGCSTLAAHGHPITEPKPFVPQNHAGDPTLPAGFRRVVLLPVAEGRVTSSESAAALDPVVIEALQRQNRFEVVPLTREDCRLHFQVESIPSVGALPANLLSLIKREYNADGILFVDLTVYNAYQPLAVGFRAKLARIDDARIVWTFDNVFSAENPEVASSAARYLKASGAAELPSQLNSVVLESPTRFVSYVSTTMFGTLPPIFSPKAPVLKAPKAGPTGPNPH